MGWPRPPAEWVSSRSTLGIPLCLQIWDLPALPGRPGRGVGRQSPGAQRAGSSWQAAGRSPGWGHPGPAWWRGAACTGWSGWPSALPCAGPAPRTVAWCPRCARSSLSRPWSPLLERKNTQSQTLCCGHPLSSPKSKTRQGLLGVKKEESWGQAPLPPLGRRLPWCRGHPEVAIDGGPLTLKFTEAHCMPDAWQAFSFDRQSHLSGEAWPLPLYRWRKWGSEWLVQDQLTCYLGADPQLLDHSPELVRIGAFQSSFWPLNFPPKDFPGTFMVVQWVKNPPHNAGDVGSIPGQGTKILTCLRGTKPMSCNHRSHN